MIRMFAVVAIVGLTLPSSGTAEDKTAPSADKLQPLARFIGEWSVEGKWSDGSELHARDTFEWSLGKKIINTKTFVKNGASEYQRYEGVLTWHPKKASLVQYNFAFDGSVSETTMQAVDNDTVRVGWVPYDPSAPSKVRQVLKFVDNDHFNWKVEVNANGAWQQIIDATWKRTK
jgi:hypothetical protein